MMLQNQNNDKQLRNNRALFTAECAEDDDYKDEDENDSELTL
jgi:hypothetical protein